MALEDLVGGIARKSMPSSGKLFDNTAGATRLTGKMPDTLWTKRMIRFGSEGRAEQSLEGGFHEAGE